MESSIAVFLKRQIACEQLPMKYKASGSDIQNAQCFQFPGGSICDSSLYGILNVVLTCLI